jgi:hypothetical protein
MILFSPPSCPMSVGSTAPSRRLPASFLRTSELSGQDCGVITSYETTARRGHTREKEREWQVFTSPARRITRSATFANSAGVPLVGERITRGLLQNWLFCWSEVGRAMTELLKLTLEKKACAFVFWKRLSKWRPRFYWESSHSTRSSGDSEREWCAGLALTEGNAPTG